MTPDEWKMIMLLEIDDFVDYYKRHYKRRSHENQPSFRTWLERFVQFSEDRQ